MEPLTAAERTELRALLDAREAETLDALAMATQGAQPVDLGIAIGRLTRVDAMQQQQMAAASRRRLEGQIAQIKQAFARMGDDTYGECVACEEPIGLARLRVKPEAPFCLRCQASRDR